MLFHFKTSLQCTVYRNYITESGFRVLDLGEVPVLQDYGSDQGPEVQTEAEPRADHLHPHRGHVGRDRF